MYETGAKHPCLQTMHAGSCRLHLFWTLDLHIIPCRVLPSPTKPTHTLVAVGTHTHTHTHTNTHNHTHTHSHTLTHIVFTSSYAQPNVHRFSTCIATSKKAADCHARTFLKPFDEIEFVLTTHTHTHTHAHTHLTRHKHTNAHTSTLEDTHT